MLGNKTVDSVLAKFKKTIAELESVKVAQENEALRQEDAVAFALAAKNEAQAEAKRAGNAVSKFKELFEV